MSIGALESYRVELQPGQDLTNLSLIRLPNGKEMVVKSIHGVKKTKDGKTIVWGKCREIPQFV